MDVIIRYKSGEKQEHVQRISSVGRHNDANKQQNKKTNGPKMLIEVVSTPLESRSNFEWVT